MQHYRYCGLHLASELPLPELSGIAADTSPIDLRIVLASVPEHLVAAIRCGEVYEIGQGEALWRLEGVGRYRVSDAGRLIEVEVAALADAESVRLFLLQPVFALASLLSGNFMLSAAAVARDGAVLALVGPSASGKSVAAAILLKRGWRLVSDSLLRITLDAHGRALAWPQAAGLCLWPDARRELGWEDTDGTVLRPGIALHRLAIPALEQALPLAHVIVLPERREQAAGLFESDPLAGARSFELLLHHMAGTTWAEMLAQRQALFNWALAACRGIGVERLAVTSSWDATLGEWLEKKTGRENETARAAC